MAKVITKKELMEMRADYVRDYVNSNNKKLIPVAVSLRILSEKVLFVTERTLYGDLAKSRSKHKEQNYYGKQEREKGKY